MIGSGWIGRMTSIRILALGHVSRVLGHYSRELGLFSLEVAVHNKMTGLPGAMPVWPDGA